MPTPIPTVDPSSPTIEEVVDPLTLAAPAPACPLLRTCDESVATHWCARGQCGIHGCPGGDCSDSPSLDLRLLE